MSWRRSSSSLPGSEESGPAGSRALTVGHWGRWDGASVAGRAAAPAAATLADYQGAVDLLADVDARLAELEGLRVVALERVRRIGTALDEHLVDGAAVQAAGAGCGLGGAGRVRDLAARAFTAEVASVLRVAPQTASVLLRQAETLTSTGLPALVSTLQGGWSAKHAAAVADEIAGLDEADATAVQAGLASLPSIGSLTPGQVASRVRVLRERLRPETIAARCEEAADARDVYLDPAKDGMAQLTAILPAVTAHAIYDRVTATARAARAAGDTRTQGQLRADTLSELLLAGPVSALPDGVSPDGASLVPLARSIVPRVHVTVPVLSLLGESDQPATLDGVVPIDPDTARRLAARAPSLRRLLTHPETGAVLSVGRDIYQVPADLRTYLQVRDVTCRFPGCTRKARYCDVDHSTDWAEGGTTSATNLAHLCRAHHTLKHQTRWTVAHHGDGTLTWTSPSGRTYTTTPYEQAAPSPPTAPAPRRAGGADDPPF
ncbi:HNH endonuclease [Antribacter sp. KLBMP9083]|uniref:HNH endonuclease n=1 Tax=Antribacter soli TaxID=2910976 RepID=A0AA41UDK5_9MICO|nr:HNH endonuclease signature motif containing protein [Antribacter soli]MCF4123179.1 HNH endonuclease [Antribacter soli]